MGIAEFIIGPAEGRTRSLGSTHPTGYVLQSQEIHRP
jgi:hypothetical protein